MAVGPDHRAVLAGLSPATRAFLTERSDRRGLLHLAGHLGLIAVGAAWIASGWPLWWAMILPHGVALAFLFALQHEATHATPFRTGWLNTFVGIAAGAVLVQPFHWFRAYHMAHHRYTGDPARDPELESGGAPETPAALAWHLSTLGYWAGKIRVLATLAAGRADERFVPPRARGRIVAEARGLVALYIAALTAMLTVAPVLFWVWLLPLASGFPVLRLYLLAEHGRCPAVANMFENSRTTLTHRAVRLLAWNMPYHGEHHAYPAVPFHKLPAFHAESRGVRRTLTEGYARFARDYVAQIGRAG